MVGQNGESLRQYLKGQPDFDDTEAEEGAKTIAMAPPSLLAVQRRRFALIRITTREQKPQRAFVDLALSGRALHLRASGQICSVCLITSATARRMSPRS